MYKIRVDGIRWYDYFVGQLETKESICAPYLRRCKAVEKAEELKIMTGQTVVVLKRGKSVATYDYATNLIEHCRYNQVEWSSHDE